MVKNRVSRITTPIFYKFFILGLFLYIIFAVVRTFTNSLFFKVDDRINLIFYRQQPVFISLGRRDNVNYFTSFDVELKVKVPGGHGRYKIGSIGRLADLEGSEDLIKRTFSSIVSTNVDFYFYPHDVVIYNNEPSVEKSLAIPKLSLVDVFLNLRYKTNANFINRAFIFFYLAQKRGGDFTYINSSVIERYPQKEKDKDKILSEKNFFVKFQGFFYQKRLREEEKNVQIYYNKYSAAQTLNRIIGGEGIRVIDLTRQKNLPKKCQVVEKNDAKNKKFSGTARFLADEYACDLVKGTVDVADVRFILGSSQEALWE